MSIKQSTSNLSEQNARQQVGDVQVHGDGNALNVVQGHVVNIDQSQKNVHWISVDEIKTRRLSTKSPYIGLSSFEERNKDIFFGRTQFVASLAAELNETNFVLLLGASGSGKSSVVKAGLVPQLSGRWGTQWVNITFRPDRNPFKAFSDVLAREFGQDAAEIDGDIGKDTLTQLVKSLKEPESFWFIFIDQFEELFTVTDIEKRDRFIESLSNLCKAYANDPFVKIVATMRSDFLDRFDAEPASQIAQITAKHRPLITQMHADELREVIEQPAALRGVVFEEGLVETIIKEVQGEAGYLPLLQYTLAMLWQAEVKDGGINDRTLNTQSYRLLGGVRGALQQRVEEIYQGFSSNEKLATQRIFLRLVGVGGDSATVAEWKPVRKREVRSRFSNKTEQKILAQLIKAKLLVSSAASVEGDKPVSTVEIAHEVLLTSWAKLRVWIEENRDAIAFRNRLNEDVEHWKPKKLDDELWSGIKLAKAEELQKDPAFQQVLGGFSKEATEFLKSSAGLRNREKQAEEARRQKEIEQERKARKAAQRVTVGALVGGFLMAGAAAFSAIQMNQAKTQQIRASVAQSKAELANNQSLDASVSSIRAARALQKSLGQKISPNPQLRLSVFNQLLETSLTGYESNRLDGEQGSISDVVFSPDGSLVAARGADAVHLWDTSGQLVSELEGHEGSISDVVFSPDGSRLATHGGSDTAYLWSAAGQLVSELEGHEDSISDVVFSPDGSLIATRETDAVRLWDKAGQLVSKLNGHADHISDVSFSPNGSLIATGGSDGTVRLWNTSGQLVTKFEAHKKSVLGGVSGLAFSPDGSQIATYGEDKTARLWNASGEQIAKFEHPSDDSEVLWNILNVVFSPDGRLIATGGADGTVRLWNTSGQSVAELKERSNDILSVVFSPDSSLVVTLRMDGHAYLWDTSEDQLTELKAHQGAVEAVAFSPNNNLIATRGTDDTVYLWDMSGKQVAELKGHQGAVEAVAFSPDESHVVTGGEDGTVRLWNIGQQILAIGEQGLIKSVAFSPDGNFIATGQADGSAHLWDAMGQQVAELKGHSGSVANVAFSPDSRLVATGDTEGTVRLWSATGQQVAEIEGHNGNISNMAFSPNSSRIAIDGPNNPLRFWDTAGQQVAEFGRKQGFSDVVLSLDGSHVVTRKEDGTAYLWNTSGEQIAEFQDNHERILGAALSPDSKLVATYGSEDIAHLWDISGRQVAELKSHHSWGISGVAFSPDSSLIATYGANTTALIWDDSGQQVAELKGQQGIIKDAIFSPDGLHITTRGEDGTIRLWSASGEQVAELEGHKESAADVVASPDGSRIATLGRDGTARLWLIGEMNNLLSKQCNRVREYLTNAPDLPKSDRTLCDGVPEFSNSLK